MGVVVKLLYFLSKNSAPSRSKPAKILGVFKYHRASLAVLGSTNPWRL